MKKYDLTIVGAGPAGMSAALFAKGDGLEFRLVENRSPGWFVEEAINTNFTHLENYLGIFDINGTELRKRFVEHIDSRQIIPVIEQIKQVKKTEKGFVVESDFDSYISSTLILATGTNPRKLEIPGLERFPNNTHYFFKNLPNYVGKTVLVVGGRNSGAVTAVRLKEMGANPVIIEKGQKFEAKGKYQEKIRYYHIPTLLNSVVEAISGTDSITVEFLQSGRRDKLFDIAGIFGCIGSEPNNQLAKQLELKLDNQGYIDVDRRMGTSNSRVFAAGDVNGGVKMIVVAAGEGAVAEYYANKYLKEQNG